MSINDINNAAAAMNQLKARYEGFLDDADAQIAQRQGAYDGLATNLKGVVGSEMTFTATVDPDAENPNRIDGGTFNTIHDAITSSPAGSFCRVKLVPGKTHPLASGISMDGRDIYIEPSGPGDRPIIETVSYSSGTHNGIRSFTPRYGGSLFIYNCNISFPTAPEDPDLPWSVARSLVAYQPSRMADVSFYRCDVSGGIDGVKMGLAISYIGAGVTMGLAHVEFNGPLYGIIGGDGAQIISQSSVTTLNGAQILEGGTIGTDTIQHGS
ncbi:hypothetical protein [Sulfitobacter pontiacus]|uniref:hypothetical protein n=1 Tax=Sulfitobacter pontiacus TaxID=60137 RepID=UPI0030EF5F7A